MRKELGQAVGTGSSTLLFGLVCPPTPPKRVLAILEQSPLFDT